MSFHCTKRQRKTTTNMKTVSLLFLVTLGSSLAAPGLQSVDQKWREWKMTYNKTYSSYEEELLRRKIWEKNLDFITAHNNQISVTYKLTMNMFGDQQSGQRRKLHVSSGFTDKTNLKKNGNTLSFIPSAFDWRKKGAVTMVINQGQKGDSEAIVANECVTSFNIIKTGQLTAGSLEEILDCCSEFKPPGFRPLVKDCFGCIHDIGGLCSESAYHSTGKCNNGSCKPVVQVDGTKMVPPEHEDQMARDLVKYGPLMAYVDASHPSFQLYKSGVYSEEECSKELVDHCLQIVGYGIQHGVPYWICKNSWGARWGEKGYILIRRGTNECGIASNAKFPV